MSVIQTYIRVRLVQVQFVCLSVCQVIVSLVLLVNDLQQSSYMGTGQRLHLDKQVYYRLYYDQKPDYDDKDV